MHVDETKPASSYTKYTTRKLMMTACCFLLMILAVVISISFGAVTIPTADVVRSLLGMSTPTRIQTIVLSIRLPVVLTAVVTGIALSMSGTVMQSILRNPLASPFTLGISHAAAFGAAFSVIIFQAGTMHSATGDAILINSPYLTMASAFLCSLSATAVIMMVSRLRRSNPEVIILTGVALGSLFTAATMFLQYFADDVQLAATVFWTFGDLSRASWRELLAMAIVTLVSTIYFYLNRWKYNVMETGDESAKGIGVQVERVRLTGMVWASVLTSVIIAFLGVIGFIGLICPHIARRLIGDDKRFLLPVASLIGAILLLLADTAARSLFAPHALPVAILTAFLGVPVFVYILLRGRIS